MIRVDNLTKRYVVGFRRRKVDVLRGISLQVRRGEILGIVGPNGAGKTTLFKILTGLSQPTSGECALFGRPVDSFMSRKNLGYLPENPYFYDHLKVEEILRYYGGLHGLSRRQMSERIDSLIARVGLDHARGRALKKFSKGMRQRAGLAQALINDPDLLILDEPQSGLDPLGRKQIRDLIFELKQQGKTILFSSHVLPDVEAVCDRVLVLHKGLVRNEGSLTQIAASATLHTELLVSGVESDTLTRSGFTPSQIERRGNLITIRLDPQQHDLFDALRKVHDAGGTIHSATPEHSPLEEFLMRDQTVTRQQADS